jgi:flagellar FliJ protein
MAGFRFRLAALLRLRELSEEKAKLGFFEAQRRYLVCSKEIEDMARLREEAKERYGRENAATTALDIETVLRQRRFINVLYARIVEKGAELRRFGAGLDEARRALAEASRQRKLLERLRERERAAFEQRLRQQEAREMDELAHSRVTARPGEDE